MLNKLFNLWIYVLATLVLCCWEPAFSSRGVCGLVLVAVHGLLIVVASLVSEHMGRRMVPWTVGPRASVVAA